MGHPSLWNIMRYHKGVEQPCFETLEQRTKEDSLGNTCKVQILVKEDTIEAGEDLLTPTEIPYNPLPT